MSRRRGGVRRRASLLVGVLTLAIAAVLGAPAIARAIDGSVLARHVVAGETPNGTTIDLFDYWITDRATPDNADSTADDLKRGINQGHALKFGKSFADGVEVEEWNKWTGTKAAGAGVIPYYGIVQNTLGADGFPVLNDAVTGGSNESLAYLFDADLPDDRISGRKSFASVGGLLKVTEQDGYYIYDSSENFAEFDESTGQFTLYDAPGVKDDPDKVASATMGQFFPFNTGGQVFGEERDRKLITTVDSQAQELNHYFGLAMTTNFVQEHGGRTKEDGQTPVTYEFTGDDDVWIFIDGVLVGDLGGIHDAASIKIDFSNGNVVVNEDSPVPGAEKRTTLRELFKAANKEDSVKWDDNNPNTFADDTYHELKFFYLERGNFASNMKLKYNLKTVPETNITKVDQLGEPLAGVGFTVWNWTNGVADAEQICSATTDAQGNLTLRDDNGAPITLEQIYAEYANQGAQDESEKCKIRLIETNTLNGYRSPAGDFTIDLRIEKCAVTGNAGHEPVYLLLSDDQWETGAYAMSKVTVTAPNEVKANGASIEDNALRDGTLFAVIQKKVGDEWLPVYGDPLGGWHVTQPTSTLEGYWQNIKTAAKATQAVFEIASSGAYQTEVSSLPGDVLEYTFFNNDRGQYRGRYYFTEASSLDRISSDNTREVDNPDAFTREFSARVYVTNIVNRLIVQKLNEQGEPVNGAKMAIWANGDVTVDADGVATVNEAAEPLVVEDTRRLNKYDEEGEVVDSIDLDGACIFSHLTTGIYWVGEYQAPEGYTKNPTLSKVIVDSTGVYADAGAADDGVTVQRGVGRIVRSMVQFATDDDIDVTLHNIVATPELCSYEEPAPGNTVGSLVKDEAAETPSPVHLEFADDGGAVLDYATEESADGDGDDANQGYVYTSDTGIPRLKVTQCAEHKPAADSAVAWEDLDDRDLTSLFTGVTVVRIADVSAGDFSLTKRVEGENANVTDSFTFDLSFETPENGLVTYDDPYEMPTSPVGEHAYRVTNEDGTVVESGTLTIGELQAEELAEGEGAAQEQAAVYYVTSVTPEATKDDAEDVPGDDAEDPSAGADDAEGVTEGNDESAPQETPGDEANDEAASGVEGAPEDVTEGVVEGGTEDVTDETAEDVAEVNASNAVETMANDAVGGPGESAAGDEAGDATDGAADSAPEADAEDQPTQSTFVRQENGSYSVKLSDGQTLTIEGLTAGTTVTASEQSAEGYTTTWTSTPANEGQQTPAEGLVAEVEIPAKEADATQHDASVTFINTVEEAKDPDEGDPDEGDPDNPDEGDPDEGDPDNPDEGDPDDGDKDPDEPDTPDNPDSDDPDVPVDPDEPDTPDVPDTPDEPDTPDTPDVPDTPDQPVTPDVPDEPTPTEPTIPEAGDTSVPALPLICLAGGGAVCLGLALAARRRGNDNGA